MTSFLEDAEGCAYKLHDEVEATPRTLHTKIVAICIGCALLVVAHANLHRSADVGVDETQLKAASTSGGGYLDVSMQCVSEFNWNQGQEATFKSATGYFVGQNGNIEISDIPTCAGGWTAHNATLTLKGNKQPRMFLKDGGNRLIMLDMTSEEVSWTQDVSKLGKTYNGAVYTTWVKPEDEDNPAEAARLYCDANDGTGNNLWCPEMDLGEANYCGFRSTSHPVTDLSANDAPQWTTNAVSCFSPLSNEQGAWLDPHASTFVKNQDSTNLFYCGLGIEGAQDFASPPRQTWTDHYGNALFFTSASAYPACTGNPADTLCSYGDGLTIDTNYEYDVNVKFDWDGYLRGFTTTLTQGSNSIQLTRQTAPNSFSVPSDGGFPSDGRVALLVQLWVSSPASGTQGAESGGSGMSWLSGPTCNVDNGETAGFPDVKETTYTIKNLRITEKSTNLSPRSKRERSVTFRTVN